MDGTEESTEQADSSTGTEQRKIPPGADLSLSEPGEDALVDLFEQEVDEQSEQDADESADAEDETEDYAEDESEDGDDEQTEDVEADEDEDNEPVYTVKVDGKDEQVPLTELLKGYSRQSDYTRKTQELAEQRKASDGELEALRAERAQLSQMAQHLQQQIQQSMPKEPDWEALNQSDPIEYFRQREEWRTRQEKMQQAQQQAAMVQQMQMQDQQRQYQQKLQQEAQALPEKIPEWKDEGKAKAEKQLLKEYGLSMGFSPEEMEQVADHRAIVLLRKAWLHDQAINNRKNLTQKVSKTRVASPGQPSTPSKKKTARTSELKQRLKRSGSDEDFTNLVHSLL